MKLESFNICKNFSEKNLIDYDLVKSINDSIFKGLNEQIRKAESLITCFAPLGNFYFRKKKPSIKLSYPSKIRGKNQDDDIEFQAHLRNIMEMYREYDADNLKFKYEKFGKESHEAFILAKKTQRIPFSKETKSS